MSKEVETGQGTWCGKLSNTEGAAVIALHIAWSHLELPRSYVQILFVKFSSA